MEMTPGIFTDYAVVERAVVEAHERFKIEMVAYDRWNAAEVTTRLVAAGVPMQEFIQGPKSYHPAMCEFERAYLSGALAYGVDPVLTWCASNLIVRTDQNLNLAPDKKKSSDKIDDIAALLMAFGAKMGEEPEPEPAFQCFFVG
jgi:phage terminase large subunit-like protein